jgi:hypothetical protein
MTTNTTLDISVYIQRAKTNNLHYPKTFTRDAFILKEVDFAMELRDYGISYFNILSDFDLETLGDLDSLTLHEMDYNI